MGWMITVNRADVAERWGVPFSDLLLDLAAQGLSARDSAAALGVSYDLVKSVSPLGLFEQSPKRSAVSIRYGVPFWSVVRRLQRDGLSKGQAARVLGYAPAAMRKLFIDNPELDPWPAPGVSVISQFLIDTGGPLGAQVRDMAARGMTAHACGVAVGYSPDTSAGAHLIEALRARGITDIKFPKRSVKRKVQAEKRGDTWYSKHRGGSKTHLRDILRREYLRQVARSE